MPKTRFWWSFEWRHSKIHAAIVESDQKDCPIVARFVGTDYGDFEKEAEQAKALVADLAAGRITVKQAMKAHLP